MASKNDLGETASQPAKKTWVSEYMEARRDYFENPDDHWLCDCPYCRQQSKQATF
jgi:hypothetical protein